MSGEITKEQLGILRHALGYNAETGTGSEYRNHYAANPDDEPLPELVEMGLIQRGSQIPGGLVYYHVTDAGKRVVREHRDIEAELIATLQEVRDWIRTDYEAAGTDAADVLGQIDDLVSRKLREVSK